MVEKESKTSMWTVVLPVLITGIFGVIVAVISNINPLISVLYSNNNRNQAVAESVGSPMPIQSLAPSTDSSPASQNANPDASPSPSSSPSASSASSVPEPQVTDDVVEKKVREVIAANAHITTHLHGLNVVVKDGVVILGGGGFGHECHVQKAMLVSLIMSQVKGIKSVAPAIACPNVPQN